jgi:hypothetical protein
VQRHPDWWTRPGAADHTELEILPLTTGKTGKWIKTGASWRDIVSAYSAKGARLVNDQRLALQALYESLGPLSYGRPTGSVELGECSGSLWFHLTNALQTGVTFLDARDRSDRVLLLDESVEFALRVARGIAGGALVTAQVTTGNDILALPAKEAGLIGEHGVFWRDDAGVLRLAQLTQRLPEAIAGLARQDDIVIPAKDIEEFRTGVGVRLASLTTIAADDPAIAPRTPERPRLALDIDYDPSHEARLSWGFRYGDRRLAPLGSTIGGSRDQLAERQLLEGLRLDRLPALKHRLLDKNRLVMATVQPDEFVDLITVVIPWLREQGVVVTIDDSFPSLRESTAAPVISIRVADDPETVDWYDLDVTVSIESEQISFVALFTALAQGQQTLVLPSGTWLTLDRPEFDRLRRLIDEARGLADVELEPGRVRVNRFQSDWWDEFAQLGIIEQQSSRW